MWTLELWESNRVPRSILKFSRRFPSEERPTGCASTLLLVTSVYLALGVAAFVAWGATGNLTWVVGYFRVPGALLLVWMALMELWLSLRVRQHFLPESSTCRKRH